MSYRLAKLMQEGQSRVVGDQLYGSISENEKQIVSKFFSSEWSREGIQALLETVQNLTDEEKKDANWDDTKTIHLFEALNLPAKVGFMRGLMNRFMNYFRLSKPKVQFEFEGFFKERTAKQSPPVVSQQSDAIQNQSSANLLVFDVRKKIEGSSSNNTSGRSSEQTPR